MRHHVALLAILAACGGRSNAESDVGTGTFDSTGSQTSPALSSESESTADASESTASTSESTSSTGGRIDRGCDEMLMIPAGPFWMGCNEKVDSQCRPEELPYHEVVLDAFEIDRCEVDAASYLACVEAGVCPFNEVAQLAACSNYDALGDLAVNCVTWAGAAGYCAWVGKQLPTEARWEKAARGTDDRMYPWGNEAPDCDLSVMNEIIGVAGCDEGHAAPPGSRPAGASPYGLFDMAGNVAEWVADDYAADYYADSPTHNPGGPEPVEGATKVMRGGGWTSGTKSGTLRASARGRLPEGYLSTSAVGFRCVAL